MVSYYLSRLNIKYLSPSPLSCSPEVFQLFSCLQSLSQSLKKCRQLWKHRKRVRTASDRSWKHPQVYNICKCSLPRNDF